MPFVFEYIANFRFMLKSLYMGDPVDSYDATFKFSCQRRNEISTTHISQGILQT